ncbi:dienelactone hydrolase [Penicillium angulare]|uniref:Dienelactone hydrolase n=1 Tax=Penicillium angulare TaxID=116970 RepID=A0A9W9FAL4_9EURO|nr:dienelactone hydrolase [Penicillium angulare]
MSCDACRTIPPVISQAYTPKGAYQTLAGLNTYITGPGNAASGIVEIYDIFGLSSPTLQGADLLATRLNALVLMPDFFHGEAAQPDWLPMDSEEKKAALMEFMSARADISKNVDALLGAVSEYRKQFPSVKSWGAFGLCWGGKVAVLASGPHTPFVATGQTHPGRMDKFDAEKLTIPHLVLASKDEPADVVQSYAEIVSNNGIGGMVKTYGSMWHGWMGARANLEGEKSLAEYIRGYTQTAEFFEEYLK